MRRFEQYKAETDRQRRYRMQFLLHWQGDSDEPFTEEELKG